MLDIKPYSGKSYINKQGFDKLPPEQRERYMKAGYGVPKYPCPVCNTKFIYRTEVKKHKVLVHGIDE